MKTRAQQEMELALKLVQEVASNYSEESKVRQIYGGLCHNFPVLVRTCGLCQAIAFSVDKAGAIDTGVSSGESEENERAQAHQILLSHVAQVLEVSANNLLETILKSSVEEYMLHTRRVLSAWVYFKRFARSILKAEPGGER